MIEKYFIALSLFTAFLVCGCENKSSNHSAPAAINAGKKKPSGKIEFTKEIHNFGTVKEGEIVAYSFQFKNSGGSPFRLTKVVPGCGCLTVQYTKETINSGVGSGIEVIFHSDGEWGNQVKSVEIETSDGETKTLTIGAYVENKSFNMDLNNLK
ncbi:MAG: DUF1573 domain-containing protein [Prolixibacteraceae bacterium]|jgi:hypothetical protein|nr:DUF1573 domain-containing protein [Prolixibacteraceae bacterium]